MFNWMRNDKGNKNKKDLRVVFIYLNFAARMNSRVSHIGLGNASFNTAKTLNDLGIKTEVWPVVDECHVIEKLEQDHEITHLIISAPWIETQTLAELCVKYKHIQFIVLSHSNVGFLSADRAGIKKLREGAILQQNVDNFCIAGNSERFCDWATIAWDVEVVYLPNLYYIKDMEIKNKSPLHCKKILKIGSFGAVRPLKNQIDACAAALEIAKKLNIYTEFWLNSGRVEGNHSTLKAIEQLAGNIDGFKIMFKEWSHVNDFRSFVGTMDLLIMPSYTESFCMVIADGIYESVPSVVSESITWVPKNWIGNMDDANQLADIGIKLLREKDAVEDGQEALRRYIKEGIKAWKKFLKV